jgi:hypothetical protein
MTPNPLVQEAADFHHVEPGTEITCKACGSHVTWYDCNEEPKFFALRPEAIGWHWWLACDNGDCQHAYGQSIWQYYPDWVDAKTS